MGGGQPPTIVLTGEDVLLASCTHTPYVQYSHRELWMQHKRAEVFLVAFWEGLGMRVNLGLSVIQDDVTPLSVMKSVTLRS